MQSEPATTGKEVLQAFGNRLRVVRQAYGISQEELAFKADLDRTYVSGIERGRRNLGLENLCRLALALEVPPALLLEDVPGLKP
jgi:transcriptional regulator with XRE-family HTH domain